MPKYFEEPTEGGTKRPCAGLKEDLKACLMESDCVTKVKLTVIHDRSSSIHGED